MDVMLLQGEGAEALKREKYELWQEANEALIASGGASKPSTITAEVRSVDD